MARALRAFVWAVAVGAALCGTARAADPAAALPSDLVVYGELTHEAAQSILGAVSMPPVAGLAPMLHAGRFSYLDQALHLPPGTAEQAARHLDRAAFGAAPPDKTMAVISFDAFPAAKLLPPNATTPLPLGPEAAVVARGSMLCIASPALCREFMAGGYPTLAGQPAFQAARKKAKDADAWSYVDMQRLEALGRPAGPPNQVRDYEEAMDAFGLANAVSLSAQADMDVPALHGVLRLGQGDSGLLGLLPSGPLDLVSMVPQKPSAALLLEWKDAPAFFGGFMGRVLQVDARYHDAGDQQMIAAFEQKAGLKLTDLFQSLGSGLVVYLPQPAEDGMLHPGQAIAVLSLKDADAFRSDLRKVLTAYGMPTVPQTFGKYPGFRLTVAPLVIAFLNDRAVIAMDRPAVEGYIKWMSSGDPAMVEKAPDACAMLYMDAGLLLHSYPQPVPGAQVRLTLARHDRDVTFNASLKNAHFSPAPVYVGMTATLAALMIPAMERAMAEARSFERQSHVQQTPEQSAPRLSDSQLEQMFKQIPRDQWGNLPPGIRSQLEAYAKAHDGS